MSNTAANHFDVAVIGLGPVGSLGALLFAEAGLRVVAIEKDTEVYRLPRAVNLDGEIIRALQPLNLAETVNAMMQPLRADERAGFTDSQRNWLFGGRSVAMGSNGWQPANMFDQPELEGFLRATVQAHPNVTCYLGYELCDFISTDATVTMRAASADEHLNVAASFMLACDGASSPTRKALNIKWRDLGYDQDWLVVDVEMLKSHELPNAVLQICDPDRIHTYVATKDPYRRWEFQLNPGETRAQMLEPQTIHALLDSWAPRDSYRLRRSAVYQFHAAVADSWQAGRVMLAGDAAHQTPPFLGQGMNSGMRDVINLAWKLPLVLNGICTPALLESYQAERNDHANDLVSWAVEMGHLMQHMAATELAQKTGKTPPEMRQTSRKSGYGQGREQPPIRSGVVVVDQVSNEGATGYLLPQPTVQDGSGNTFRFDELLGSGFALIANGPLRPNKASATLMEVLGIAAVDVSTLQILEGKFPEQLNQGEVLLIRPDRLVFGHTDAHLSIDALIAALADALKLSPEHYPPGQ